MGKQHFILKASERRKIKQLFQRKLLSHKARQQLEVLLFLDKKSEPIIAIAQNVGVSTQTLYKWRKDFREKQLDSLIVNTEIFSQTETAKRGRVKIVLTIPDEKEQIEEEVKADDNSEEDKDSLSFEDDQGNQGP